MPELFIPPQQKNPAYTPPPSAPGPSFFGPRGGSSFSAARGAAGYPSLSPAMLEFARKRRMVPMLSLDQPLGRPSVTTPTAPPAAPGSPAPWLPWGRGSGAGTGPAPPAGGGNPPPWESWGGGGSLPSEQYGVGNTFLGNDALFALLRSLIGGAGEAGAFDPSGEGAVLEGLRGEATRAGAAASKRAQLAAQASGRYDPSAVGGAIAQAQSSAYEPFSEIMSQGRFQLGREREQYGRQLLDWLLNLAGQRNLAKLGGKIQEGQQPEWWEQAIGAGGALAGSWLAPGGIWKGAGR